MGARPSGYTYSDHRIERFSMTHIDGAGCNVSGDIPFMPTTEALVSAPPTSGERYSATFSHSHETAEPGYYSVLLGNGISVELTTTLRSGFARIQYPKGQRQTLLIETGTDIQTVYDAQAQVIGPNEVAGWVRGGHFCNVLSSTYTIYFVAQFSRPASAFGAVAWRRVARSTSGARIAERAIPGFSARFWERGALQGWAVVRERRERAGESGGGESRLGLRWSAHLRTCHME